MFRVSVRKTSSLAALAFAVTLVSVACSGSSGGSGGAPIRPLSTNESARLKGAVKSFGTVTNLGNEFAVTRQTGSTGPRPILHALASASTPSKLKEVIDQSNCQKTMKFPDETEPLKAGDNTIPTFIYDVSGPGCPLRYHAELTGTQFYDAQNQPNGLKAILKYEYQAFTQEALEAADVDLMDMHGDIEVRVDVTANGTQTVKFTISFGGTGHSQKEGDFRVSQAFDGNIRISMGTGSQGPNPQPAPPGGEMPMPNIDIQGSMMETMLFTFKDIAAELKANVVMSGFSQTADYRINGKSVDQAEYDEYHNALNVPGMGDDKNQPNPGGNPGPMGLLVCEARVYLSTDITPGTLQDELNQGRIPQMQPRSHFEACSAFGPRQTSWFPDGDFQFDYLFDFSDPKIASGTVKICSSLDPANCTSVSRSFLTDEARGFGVAAGKYSVMLRCEVKQSCF